MVKISALVAALRLLGRKNYFSEELVQKLQAKGYEKEEIEGAIQSLLKEGYLNDEEQLRRFVANKQSRGYGPAAIRWQLRGKCRMELEVSLEEQISAIHDFLAKRAPDWKERDYKSKQALFATLQRRGFSMEAIMKSCGQNANEDL